MVSYLEPKRHLIQAFCHRCMNLLEASQSHFLHEKWDQILVLILHETKQAKNSVCVQINIKSSLKFFNSICCKKVFKQRNHDQRAQFFYSLWFQGGCFQKKETKLKTKRKTVDFSDSSPSFLYLSNVSKSAHFSLLDLFQVFWISLHAPKRELSWVEHMNHPSLLIHVEQYKHMDHPSPLFHIEQYIIVMLCSYLINEIAL